MRQREGQRIRYRFNMAAELCGQELSWSAIRLECWGSLVFVNVVKEFGHADGGQKSWPLKMAACPCRMKGRRNFAARWMCSNNKSEKPPRPKFLHKTNGSRIVEVLTRLCWACETLVAFMRNHWTAPILTDYNIKAGGYLQHNMIVGPVFPAVDFSKNQLPQHPPKSRAVNESKLWVAIKSLIDHIDLAMVPLTFNGHHLQ